MWYSILIEYLKVLAWPTITAFALFVFFRKNIALLIDRIRIIKGPAGTEIRAEEQAKAEEQKSTRKKIEPKNTKKIEKIAKKQIEKIKNDYEQSLSEEKKSKESEIKYLIDQLSVRNLELEFERIYSIIFGSQIVLLRELLSQFPKGKEVGYIMLYFKTIQNTYPIYQSWDPVQYINFLLVNDLVLYENDEKIYKITDKGISFLNYISNLGYLENKGN